MNEKVSIGIPVLNGGSLVRAAIQSALNQTHPNIEIIILDNASIDDTKSICQEIALLEGNVRYIRNDRTMSATENFEAVLKIAEGVFFAWLSHDDTYEPTFVEECLEALRNMPHLIGCCSELYFKDPDGNILGSWTDSFSNLDASSLYFPNRITSLFRRVGWYATYSLWRRDVLLESLPIPRGYASDVRHLGKILQFGPIGKVPKKLFNYTVDRNRDSSYYARTADYSREEDKYFAEHQPYTFLYLQLVEQIVDSSVIENGTKNIALEEIYKELTQNVDWMSRIRREMGASSVSGSERVEAFLQEITADQQRKINTSLISEKKTEKATLIFFPHCPLPEKSGAHARCISIIKALKKNGHAVHLVSCQTYADQKWTDEKVYQLEREFSIKVYVISLLETDIKTIKDASRRKSLINEDFYCPPSLKSGFGLIFERVKPTHVLINYVYWQSLCGIKTASVKYIIDTHDIITQNNIVRNNSNPNRITLSFDEKIDPSELDALGWFDEVIAISRRDEKVFRKNLSGHQITYIPHISSDIRSTTKVGRVVFVGSDNPMNIQGIGLFVSEVLPILLQDNPYFNLDVYGAICSRIAKVKGLTLHGYVDDRHAIYDGASVAICPLLNATGQQVKITEALSYGVPAVCFSNLREGNLMVDGRSGYYCENGTEFAEKVIRLSNNRSLCELFGENAKSDIEEIIKETENKIKTMFGSPSTAG